jgi:hypothetical protein
MKRKLSEDIKSLINAYEFLVKGIDTKAKEAEDRAYGGIIRAGKGMLVESLAKSLIEIAWKELGKDPSRLSLEKKVVKIPIKKEYIQRIKNPEVKRFIKEHINDFYYPLKTDVHVHVDGEFKIAIECKAYTENAMLKRILVDFTLLKQVYPDLAFVLFQLESQLGGDYSSPNYIKYGSPSTHTLLSYFDIDLNIITLLEGERQVDKPIHRPEYYKALREDSLLNALKVLMDLLR